MAAPTVEQIRAAASGITAMADGDFKARRSREAGDSLVAFMVILAKKLFPQDTEGPIAKRVELMLAAYFLRGDLDRSKVVAPDEATAKQAVDRVAGLDGATLDQRVTAEVGDPALAFFSAFTHKVLSETDPDRRAMNVQLMILAYLLRGELTATPKGNDR